MNALAVNNPLVSIITPSFNSQEFLRETYASIVNQTHEEWEWLVTDDRSSDSTIDILNEIATSDPRVRVFLQSENQGAAHARNVSLGKARGDFIAFLDSDDCWHPQKLQRQLEFMSSGCNFSFTGYEIVDSDGNRTGRSVDCGRNGVFTYRDMLRKKATLGCSTVMLRAAAFPRLSMPLIRTGQDYALWLKLLRQGGVAHLLGEALTRYRIVPTSISRNKVRKAMRQWQIYRQLEQLPLGTSAICFLHYGYRAVFRR